MKNTDTFLITENAFLKDAIKEMDKVGAKNFFVIDAEMDDANVAVVQNKP